MTTLPATVTARDGKSATLRASDGSHVVRVVLHERSRVRVGHEACVTEDDGYHEAFIRGRQYPTLSITHH